jgi:hypothetical protein
LAQALEIAPTVIARVMIEVRRGQNHAGSPHLCRLLEIGPSGRPAAAVAPRVTGGVEPTAIRQTAYSHAMWPAASLAHASGALEPHAPADLWPIAGVEPPHFRLDRHRHLRSRDGGLLGQHAINACPANAEPDLGFEFGEHAQHIEERLARRGAGIDRLFGRLQGDTLGLELGTLLWRGRWMWFVT